MKIMHLMLAMLILSIAVPTFADDEKPADKAPAKAEAAEKKPTLRGDELNDAVKKSVKRGLAWLAKRQTKEGAFGSGTSGYGRHVGITGLAGIAFMSAGNLPGRGEYGEQVRKTVDFIVANTQETGLISADGSHGQMYSHGFAALFLGEVYGMTHDEKTKEALQRCIKLIQKTQNQAGGWRYNPTPYDADISVTICQVMALRAARDAGIKVEDEVIKKAIDYVRKCQNKDGGFSYTQGSGSSGWQRSGAGLATLFYAGISKGDEIKRGVSYMRRFTPGKAGAGRSSSHYYYGHYYAIQAAFLSGGDFWHEWYTGVRNELIKRQNSDGSWSGSVSGEYCTSIALIILQMPNRYLPVFHGKGEGS